ncbi:MAG: hypothetical protein WBN75_19365 [Verrucomicrobiia bacterium]|jgi:hypothetical protein
MKTLTIPLLLSFLIFASRLFGQDVATNKITRSEAIKIASHLTIGMQQVEAGKVLERSGFKEVPALSFHSSLLQHYPLADGCDLCLEYRPTLDSTNGPVLVLATSRLQQASINSNGVQFISISLTNAP